MNDFANTCLVCFARLSSHVSRLHSQLCEIERFIGELKSVGVDFCTDCDK